MAPTWLSSPDGLLPTPPGASPQQSVRHGGALATLVAGRRALLMLVAESTLLALAGRVNDAADGSRSATAPARACGEGVPGLIPTSSDAGRLPELGVRACQHVQSACRGNSNDWAVKRLPSGGVP